MTGEESAVVGLHVIAPQQQMRDIVRDTATVRPNVESRPAVVAVQPYKLGVGLAQQVYCFFSFGLITTLTPK